MRPGLLLVLSACAAVEHRSWAPLAPSVEHTGFVDELVEEDLVEDLVEEPGDPEEPCPPGAATAPPPLVDGRAWRLVACLGDHVTARIDVLELDGDTWCGTSHHLVEARAWTSAQGLDFVELVELTRAPSPATTGHTPGAGCVDDEVPTVWALAWGYARFLADDGSTDRLPTVRSSSWDGGTRIEAWGAR